MTYALQRSFASRVVQFGSTAHFDHRRRELDRSEQGGRVTRFMIAVSVYPKPARPKPRSGMRGYCLRRSQKTRSGCPF
jgi:hypothetical protein